MPDRLVSLADVQRARTALQGQIHRTPLLSSATAARVIRHSTGVEIADDRLHLKAEHLQKTGSFKPRGALSVLASLTPEEKARGVITLSAGNAAQAYAWAGAAAGVSVTVVMPAAAVRSKVDACIAYGAEVVLHGAHTGETWERMQELQRERGSIYVSPFDHPALIAGTGSVGLELLEDLPDVDVVVVGVGGGGLISGTATALKESRPGIRVYGVEPENANAMRLALDANEIVRLQPSSVADGLGAPFAGEWTLATVQHYVDDVILLDDATILAGLRFALERTKQVVEPAGAAALAALLFGRIPLRRGDRVATVLSGGNIDLSRVGEFLDAAAPLPPI
jgi:threonine dehydratase